MAAKEPRVKGRRVDERDLVAAVGGDALLEVAECRECGPIRFSGTDDALCERHPTFDDVVPLAEAAPRASASRQLRARCGICSHSAGSTRSRAARARTPGAITTSRWSTRSVARSDMT
jgi:hypothetical protein